MSARPIRDTTEATEAAVALNQYLTNEAPPAFSWTALEELAATIESFLTRSARVPTGEWNECKR